MIPIYPIFKNVIYTLFTVIYKIVYNQKPLYIAIYD